ncbi:UNVERIFIED_CONTAM: hypothetical protein K2H54_056064 [Gekko kuhli]
MSSGLYCRTERRLRREIYSSFFSLTFFFMCLQSSQSLVNKILPFLDFLKIGNFLLQKPDQLALLTSEVRLLFQEENKHGTFGGVACNQQQLTQFPAAPKSQLAPHRT